MSKQLETLSRDPTRNVFCSSEQRYSIGAKREEGEKKVNEMLHTKKRRKYTPEASLGAHQFVLGRPNVTLDAMTPSVLPSPQGAYMRTIYPTLRSVSSVISGLPKTKTIELKEFFVDCIPVVVPVPFPKAPVKPWCSERAAAGGVESD